MRYCSFVQISEVIDNHAMMRVHVELNTLIMIVMIVTVQYVQPMGEPFLMQCLKAYPKCQIDRTLEWLKRNEFE